LAYHNPDFGAEESLTSIATVQARGQVTLPKEIRDAAGIKPGDRVWVRVVGHGVIEFSRLPVLTLEEILSAYEPCPDLDIEALRLEAEEAAANEFFERMKWNSE
jgi:AbrB family looped-hinge helix DNA binding protein